jgi:hypothetical protein
VGGVDAGVELEVGLQLFGLFGVQSTRAETAAAGETGGAFDVGVRYAAVPIMATLVIDIS